MKHAALVLALAFLIPVPVFAADPAAPAEAAAPQDAPKDAKPAAEPAAEEGVNLKAADKFKDKAEDLKADLAAKLEKLQDKLDDKQRRHLSIIYNNHNLIETVKTVEGDVGRAVKACGEKNPDLEGKMTARFKDWSGAVDAKLAEAEGLTQNMIAVQDYASKDELSDALKAADAMRAHSQTIYEKVPVTSKEACDFLYEKMEETKDNMIALLSTTLISVPEEMQKANEDKAAEDKASDEKVPEDSKPAEPKADAPAETQDEAPPAEEPAEDKAQ
jgi:hypothetical protein